MIGKPKKIILFSILAIVVIGVSIGLYLYFKGPPDIKNTSPDYKLEAIALYQSFITDSAQANKKYDDKVLEVMGVVTQVSQNQSKLNIVFLKTNTEGGNVNCTFEGPPGSIKEGSQATIKGLCSGIGQGDTDLGLAGDVYLTRCYFVK